MSKTIEDIRSSTIRIADEIASSRHAAHMKHGNNSIEAIDGEDPRWLSILVEESGEVSDVLVSVFAGTILAKAVGRVAHELTYDANTTLGDQMESVRRELIDTASVAIAWIDSIDQVLASEPFQPDFGEED